MAPLAKRRRNPPLYEQGVANTEHFRPNQRSLLRSSDHQNRIQVDNVRTVVDQNEAELSAGYTEDTSTRTGKEILTTQAYILNVDMVDFGNRPRGHGNKFAQIARGTSKGHTNGGARRIVDPRVE